MCGMVVWSDEQSDEVAAWVHRHRSMCKESGASPTVPPESLRAAAEIVAKSLAKLCQSGVPIDVALRALAAALVAIGRHRGASTFAEAWSVQDLALGFLIGAFKSEWRSVKDKDESPCATSLQACVAAPSYASSQSQGRHCHACERGPSLCQRSRSGREP